VISGGRLVLGIGVGGTVRSASPQQSGQAESAGGNGPAEYAAYGLTAVPPGEGIGRLSETITIIRRMFTEDEFDFDGRYYTLSGTINEPKPVQRPGPPVLVGGSGTRLLRLVAEQADIWNIPGPPHGSLEFLAERSRVLDQHCADIGRAPASITRSTQLVISTDDPASVRAMVTDLVAAGFRHIVFGVRPPAPDNVPRWLADEIIKPVLQEAAG
jgi:alkanesulfonate monooxygenase SsuD/methylene tetrahydromethanopterin reductase-like flavin-dependent oxidoreductase (luciferase family)